MRAINPAGGIGEGRGVYQGTGGKEQIASETSWLVGAPAKLNQNNEVRLTQNTTYCQRGPSQERALRKGGGTLVGKYFYEVGGQVKKNAGGLSKEEEVESVV